jgi:hypothetical protein
MQLNSSIIFAQIGKVKTFQISKITPLGKIESTLNWGNDCEK